MNTKQSIFASRRGADCDQNEPIKVNGYSFQRTEQVPNLGVTTTELTTTWKIVRYNKGLIQQIEAFIHAASSCTEQIRQPHSLQLLTLQN